MGDYAYMSIVQHPLSLSMAEGWLYLQWTQVTIVVLYDLGWQVVQDVILHPSQHEGKDLLVQGLHRKSTCTE